MEWIVKIEGEKHQRIRIRFNPVVETIHFYGECRVKNNEWTIFSEALHKIDISLEEIQITMVKVMGDLRKRLKEYENLDKGFSVLKEVAFEED